MGWLNKLWEGGRSWGEDYDPVDVKVNSADGFRSADVLMLNIAGDLDSKPVPFHGSCPDSVPSHGAGRGKPALWNLPSFFTSDTVEPKASLSMTLIYFDN